MSLYQKLLRLRTATLVLGLACILSLVAGAAGDDVDLFSVFTWRNIGPANMGGRISDIQALEQDYRYVVVASASGGVWKSTNAGTTWEPIFDRYGSASIGAVGLCQNNPDIIWVGTGEANVRNSVGWGDGVYRSTDGGKTFQNVGLKDSHHIAHIATHPADFETAYVASQGHLWGYTGERGLHKTTDGGATWQKLTHGLPDDGKTGCTDVRVDPHNPEVLYAAFWQRIRYPYRFESGGPGGGLFKSTNGGQSWRKMTHGLPEGDIGRIGIAVYRKDPQIVMAIVEHGFQPRPGSKDYDDLSKLGSGIYRSEDGGETWTYLNRYNNRPFYYSQIYINPSDDKLVYAMGTRARVSEDGGRTFREGMPGIAGDFHVMWLDPNTKERYYVGNDKGISITHDHGIHFNFFDNFCISQVYAVSADLRDPYYVYVGLQDNGVWGAPSNSRDFNGIFNDHWFKFHSGDGFYTSPDPLDWRTVYTESQNGRIRRNHAVFRQQSTNITPGPKNTLNWNNFVPARVDPERPRVRMNWNTPFLVSRFNPHTIYYGANHLFKSMDRGDHWRIISPDLSTNHPEKTLRESGGLTRDVTGAETHCTIVTISESPLKPGLIWVGTDDGNIQVTRDDGAHWENVRPNIQGVPEAIWVSRVEASHFERGTCYVTLDGHRNDLFRPFIFKTTDYGKTWVNITANLPDGHCVYVIREDPKNKNLLFVGTEFGVFASVDGGQSWQRFMNGLPTVAVHDLLIHPNTDDLIAGTHGRGVWICDDISPLQQLSESILDGRAHIFENPTATLWRGISRGGTRGHQLFIGHNPSSISRVDPSNSPTEVKITATINYYLPQQIQGNPQLQISDITGQMVREITLEESPGINRFRWDLRFNPSEKKKTAFLRRMESVFESLRSRIDPQEKDDLERLYQEFKKAQTIEALDAVRRMLVEHFRIYAERRGFFPGELEGPPAGPGTYLLKLFVGGRTVSGHIIVREDPWLDNES